MRASSRATAAAVCALALVPVAAWGEGDDASVAMGPREAALGESLVAAPFGATATRLNPAGVALARTYVIEGTVGLQSKDDARSLAASVCDSTTARVAACLYYDRVTSSATDGDRSLSEVGITTAMPLGEWLLIGITNKYVSSSAPEGAPEGSRDGYLFDAGLIIKPTGWLHLGASERNMVGHDDTRFARFLGAGIAIAFPVVTIAADVRQNLATDKNRYGAGIEYFLGASDGLGGYPLRAGWIRDEALGTSFATAGLGFVTPRMALDVAARRQLDSGDEWAATVGLRLFVQN